MIYRYFFIPRMGYIVGKETFFLFKKQGAARIKWVYSLLLNLSPKT